MGHRLAGGVLSNLLGGERSALAGALETNAASAGPPDNVALHVGNGDERVIESGENVRDAGTDVLGVLGLNDLLLLRAFAEQFGGGGRSHGGRDFARLSGVFCRRFSARRGASSSGGFIALFRLRRLFRFGLLGFRLISRRFLFLLLCLVSHISISISEYLSSPAGCVARPRSSGTLSLTGVGGGVLDAVSQATHVADCP